jgi:hypothetical protein
MLLALYVIGSLGAIIFLSVKLRSANEQIRQMKSVMPSWTFTVPMNDIADFLTEPERPERTGGHG